MVFYCCVKGCGNNNNSKKKNSGANVSFHAFPCNSELRLKWLRAIGRPNWNPPAHTRICSVHFSRDQLSRDKVRTRIMDQACPVHALPPDSNFEASNVEVCRICLATDLKLHTLEDGKLKICMESIAGFNENLNIEALPQFVCYECAAHVMKCYKLVEKSMVAQAALLDIFAQNGRVTRNLVKGQNRIKLNLASDLYSHNVTPTALYKFQYDQDYFYNFEYGIKEENSYKNEDHKIETNSLDINNDLLEKHRTNEIETDENESVCKAEEPKSINDEQIGSDHTESVIEGVELFGNDVDSKYCGVDADEGNDVQEFKIKRNKTARTAEQKTRCIVKNLETTRPLNGLAREEVNLQEHFVIEKILTLEEQISEWKSSLEPHDKQSSVHQCEVCSRSFANVKAYRIHTAGHDQSRGEAECPVCKLRFKSASFALSHRKYTHSNKFRCKSCPRVFNSSGMAKRHHKSHAHGREPRASVLARRPACARCGRAFRTRRGLLLHHAVVHKGLAEMEVRQEFRCEECELGFESEGARRVHYLTAPEHRKNIRLLEPTATASDWAPPRRSTKSSYYKLPDDNYPKQCDHCEVTVGNRKEHWSHMRRRHQSERASYQPVVLAVCDTCGKGFQNKTKLRIHELRHSSPSVRCEFCPKVFYDKYRLAGHLACHSDARPHRCAACGRGFKLRGNLDRHQRVHTDEAAYECTLCGKKFKYSTSLNLHVRTVHQRIPPPPRKRKVRDKAPDGESEQIK